MDDEGGGLPKLREENEMIREELEIHREAYAIELIIGSTREEEEEDDQSIAEVYGLATEEKEGADEYEEDWKSQEDKEEITISSDEEEERIERTRRIGNELGNGQGVTRKEYEYDSN